MIRMRLGHLLLDRDMKLKDLAEQAGIAVNNLSILKTNKARAIRFSTLEALCRVLQCSPGDLLEYLPGEHGRAATEDLEQEDV
ncbi:MAG: helix-turn-helix transcriptional regulator [Phycisphaerae bacterium]|nr:helix-turn-helix transcriptional regulator [Phycisphaerae bacterium]